jgi:hypothetical protein
MTGGVNNISTALTGPVNGRNVGNVLSIGQLYFVANQEINIARRPNERSYLVSGFAKTGN